MSTTIKDLFEKAENGTLTYEQFEALAKDNEVKFVNLKDGNYVSKSKYESDIEKVNQQVETLSTQINDLNGTITSRDADLEDLKKQLEQAGEDKAKLDALNTSMADLQTKYEADIKAREDKLRQQSYEFAVREYANTQKFSSKAAKRDFVKAMIDRNLQMDGDKLIGGDDFRAKYAEENDDAFYVEPAPTPAPEPTPTPDPTPAPAEPKQEPLPIMVAPTQGAQDDGGDTFDFGFVGVRAHE